jgi:hypothetical protein
MKDVERFGEKLIRLPEPVTKKAAKKATPKSSKK